jgi:hypothetical protein
MVATHVSCFSTLISREASIGNTYGGLEDKRGI